MTRLELATHIKRTKGKVMVPVHTGEDIVHLPAEKAGLVELLLEHSPDESAPWEIDFDVNWCIWVDIPL